MTTETLYVDAMTYEVDRYADGSVAAVGISDAIEVEAGELQVQGIRGCTYTSGSGFRTYSGCHLDGVWGTVTAGAYQMSWTIVQGGSDSITNAGIPFQNCYPPTSCSSPTLVNWKPVEGGGLAAARWQADVTSTIGGSWNAWAEVRVGADAYSSSTSSVHPEVDYESEPESALRL